MPTRADRLAYNRDYYQRNKHKWNKRTPEQREAYNARRRAEYANNPAVREEVAIQGKKYRGRRDPEVRLAKQYNLDPFDLELATDRGCAICGAAFTVTGNSIGDGEVKRHIDHDHRTGRTRGVLCQSCNLAIGHMADDPVIAAAALRYLMNGGDRGLEA